MVPVYLGPQPVKPAPVWGSWYTAEKAQQPKIIAGPVPQSNETRMVAAPSRVGVTPEIPLIILPEASSPAPADQPTSRLKNEASEIPPSPWFVRAQRHPAVAVPDSTPAHQTVAAARYAAKTITLQPKPGVRQETPQKHTVLKSKTASRAKRKKTVHA
jgi:hypothetical protein